MRTFVCACKCLFCLLFCDNSNILIMVWSESESESVMSDRRLRELWRSREWESYWAEMGRIGRFYDYPLEDFVGPVPSDYDGIAHNIQRGRLESAYAMADVGHWTTNLHRAMVRHKVGFIWRDRRASGPFPHKCKGSGYFWIVPHEYDGEEDPNIPGVLHKCSECCTYRVVLVKTKNFQTHLLHNYYRTRTAFLIERYMFSREHRQSSWECYHAGLARGDTFVITSKMVPNIWNMRRAYCDPLLGLEFRR